MPRKKDTYRAQRRNAARKPDGKTTFRERWDAARYPYTAGNKGKKK
jgi:hypothetical protein